MISFSKYNSNNIITIVQRIRVKHYSVFEYQQKPTTASPSSNSPSSFPSDDGYTKKLSRVHMKSETSIWDYAVNRFQKSPKPGKWWKQCQCDEETLNNNSITDHHEHYNHLPIRQLLLLQYIYQMMYVSLSKCISSYVYWNIDNMEKYI